MRILITNDDGINAPGLQVLAAIAAEIAGPGGEVWTVAPAFEQSGVGHAISYANPTMIAELGARRFAAEGSPADCVLAAVYDVMQGRPPDLVLSGVNRGNNAGENAVYSGTIGGAMEGALQGLPAIALSQFMGPGNLTLADPFDAARAYGVRAVRRILDHNSWDGGAYRLFYNVNFPPCPAEAVQGLRATVQGCREGTRHQVEPFDSPNGRRYLWARTGPQAVAAGANSDVDATLAGYVAITPMTADLTAHDRLAALSVAIDEG